MNHQQVPSIAIAHNRYQGFGGEDKYTEILLKNLKDHKHPVFYLEENSNQIKQYSPIQKIKLGIDSTWSLGSFHKYSQIFRNHSIDLLHVQNFQPLITPSIHTAAQKYNIPSIQHLHHYRLGCINAYLFRDNQICEACVGKNPWRGVVKRCYRNSLPASLSVWGMISFNRWRKTWLQAVDAFIACSQFVANKYVEFGLPNSKIHVVPNASIDPLYTRDITNPPPLKNFLYLGRLSSEKGVLHLLKAWEMVNDFDWTLNIAGNGPQRSEIEDFIRQKKLDNVNILGHLNPNQVNDLIQNSTIVLVPSQCYEAFGLGVTESFALGRPVIVSNLGGLPEIVDEAETGFILPANDLNAWAERIKWCAENPSILAQMGHKARQVYLKKYTPEVNYQQLISIYNQVLH
jgi:glycosyltransferase involved in cell wall biosynthesis